MILLQPELISNAYKIEHGITKGGRVVEANWLHIYSYLQPSYFTRLGMKCLVVYVLVSTLDVYLFLFQLWY